MVLPKIYKMNPSPLLKKEPQRILVISLRFLGDTLLATALINSLKSAYPNVKIDVLVYQTNVLMLEGNQAISNCIISPLKPTIADYKTLVKRIFRRYDLSISTQTGDRPTLYAFLAASTRIGLVPQKSQQGWFKRYLFQRWLEFDINKTHTVLELLRLCQLLAIKPIYELTVPSTTIAYPQIFSKPYVVMHIIPQWRYKQWISDGWIEIANYLKKQGFQLVLSGSPAIKEMNYLAEIQQQFPIDTINLAGKVSLSQLAKIIEKAELFIGPDTSITHLAAATGVKTLALFGPSDPVKWSPWPKNYHSNKPPFKTKGCQKVNNVYLIQGNQACVPCYLEGCDRHQQSHSACLDMISVEQVKKIIKDALNEK